MSSFPVPLAEFEIRRLSGFDEFSEVVRLQREIWGYDDVELLPLRLFVVAEKIGGQVLGAFTSRKMVAFCLCIPGLKPDGKYYLHSHMLGVLPAYRNSGLGRKLKLQQRRYAMEAGVDLIEWTFDPLELKNAFFNIERLGVIVRRYVHNQYGTTSSHLHAGLPTDRLVPEWWIDSGRVRDLLERGAFDRPTPQASISVPSNIGHLRRTSPARACDLQREVAAQFEEYFRAGLAVIGFERGDPSSRYLLGPWPS